MVHMTDVRIICVFQSTCVMSNSTELTQDHVCVYLGRINYNEL